MSGSGQSCWVLSLDCCVRHAGVSSGREGCSLGGGVSLRRGLCDPLLDVVHRGGGDGGWERDFSLGRLDAVERRGWRVVNYRSLDAATACRFWRSDNVIEMRKDGCWGRLLRRRELAECFTCQDAELRSAVRSAKRTCHKVPRASDPGFWPLSTVLAPFFWDGKAPPHLHSPCRMRAWSCQRQMPDA